MSTEAYMRRDRHGLAPATQYDAEILSLYPHGCDVRVTIRRQRSVPQHRLFFALVSHVAAAVGRSTDDLLDVIKLDTGHYRVVERRGERLRVPASIAFDRMDAAQFRDFFERAVVSIAEETGVYQPDLLDDLRARFPALFGGE